ncbi:MAG: N-formylglutamate amidohydrolase [Sulfitobacter sp.]|jgi:predicted N-formylglutamate amidohydrolase|nr:N-formylglutamate amidohydrolase [Sulfitobacter sp.]
MKPAELTSHEDSVRMFNTKGASPVVVVCEHASAFIPTKYSNLGLAGGALQSHAAWDPGALALAKALSVRLNAKLVTSGVSRLVYDCNRPPLAADAMPYQSEAITVPGNQNLTAEQRQERVESYYEPFHAALAETIAATAMPVIVTIHSFTPIYHGKTRVVEIGVLHDSDTRLADVMLDCAHDHTDRLVERNKPYGPEHGVTHTLKEHALVNGHLNVMLEVRNDLIQETEQQENMAQSIANWLSDALARLQIEGVAQCQA